MSQEKESSFIPPPSPDYIEQDSKIEEIEAPSVPTHSTFSMGRPSSNSNSIRRRQRERQRPQQRQRQIKVKKVKPGNGAFRWPAFPLLYTKYYSFQLTFMLGGFPRSSVQAVQHFHKLIAPAQTPGYFSMKPEEIRDLCKAFYENIRARWSFRKLLLIWKWKRCRQINEDDPMTLEPVKEEIKLCDLQNKAIYTFEAKSLWRVWRINLLHHDGVFPEPKMPTNPLTNLPLSLLQVHMAFQCLRKKGYMDWVLDSFQACHYDLMLWQRKFGTPLKVESLNSIFEDKASFDRFDMLMDFAELQHDYHGIDFPKKMFDWIFSSHQVDEYAEMWIKACKKFYVEKYTTTDKDELEEMEVRASVLNAHLVEIPKIVKVLYDKYLERIRENGRRRVQQRILASNGNSAV